MKNMEKGRKALSPVVSAIILLAVAVAVSLAVAAWMGTLTVGQMETEEIKILNVAFESGNATLELKNTGVTDVVITDIRIGNGSDLLDTNLVINANSLGTATVTLDWTPGYRYQFKAMSKKGNFFIYNAIAPNP